MEVGHPVRERGMFSQLNIEPINLLPSFPPLLDYRDVTIKNKNLLKVIGCLTSLDNWIWHFSEEDGNQIVWLKLDYTSTHLEKWV